MRHSNCSHGVKAIALPKQVATGNFPATAGRYLVFSFGSVLRY
jgi:hypothetical protein